jgi:hypothetical protein
VGGGSRGPQRAGHQGAGVLDVLDVRLSRGDRDRDGQAAVIPVQAWAGGLAAAIVIGALAGLLPAIRAARLAPTQALWSM